ncbi:MAG: replication endonuclease, partial [Limisphaerales bacterium]
RTVEPHHDATPHWHVIVFVHPSQAGALLAILREYALQDSPNENGAAEARFHATAIDPAKGSAAQYVAMYISKNIDGHGVGTDNEADQPAEVTAPRAVVWARVWGIRQFQFFGVGPITPARELYRLDHIPTALEQVLGDAHRALKLKDHGGYLKALEARKTCLGNATTERESTRYPGEIVKRVCGVRINGGEELQTRFDIWAIGRRAEANTATVCPSRTRFNNSAQIVLKGNSLHKKLEPPWSPTIDRWWPPSEPDLWLRGQDLDDWNREHAEANAERQMNPCADGAHVGVQKKTNPRVENRDELTRG